jgi:hypothetical protein
MTDNIPLVYGVWVEGQGWLKDHGRIFSDMRHEYAEEVLRFMVGTPAHIALIDDSMIALESLFLAKEEERKTKALRKEDKLNNLYRYLLRIRS